MPSTVWAAWEIDQKRGQYSCFVEQVAGIRITTDQLPASGKITLLESKTDAVGKAEPVVEVR